MNEMRKLMETLEAIEDNDIHYDPQPGDDEPLEYHDEPGKYPKKFMGGGVEIILHGDGEITLQHGQGENIFLTQEEFDEFVVELEDNVKWLSPAYND